MNTENRAGDSAEHREISALLPWYTNGTLSEEERAKVDAHATVCPDCRADLLIEQQVFDRVSAQAAVEYMPTASLKRLQARIDATSDAREPAAAAPTARVHRRARPWTAAIAASLTVLAVAVALLGVDRWMDHRARGGAEFFTVTNATPRAADEVIRAVFAPSITLVELQSLLDEAQLRIVAGPTEAGVYSLAEKSDRPVMTSLAQLRSHTAVRFAESTRPDPESGHSP